jgi:hypothetical protein
MLVLTGFIFFMIYFIFKSLQFVVQAINLYKDMISRQDMMIKQLEYIKNRLGNIDESSKEPSSDDSIKPVAHFLDDSDREILKRFAFLKKERPNLTENELVNLICETDGFNQNQVKATIKKAKEIQKSQSTN